MESKLVSEAASHKYVFTSLFLVPTQIVGTRDYFPFAFVISLIKSGSAIVRSSFG